jgi:hypothetical protein
MKVCKRQILTRRRIILLLEIRLVRHLFKASRLSKDGRNREATKQRCVFVYICHRSHSMSCDQCQGIMGKL